MHSDYHQIFNQGLEFLFLVLLVHSQGNPRVIIKVCYQSFFFLGSWPKLKSNDFLINVRFSRTNATTCGCLNSSFKYQELHHISATTVPLSPPPSQPSVSLASCISAVRDESQTLGREKKMCKHMEEIKGSWNVADLICTLRELSSKLVNLHLLGKASGSSELLSSGKHMNCDS